MFSFFLFLYLSLHQYLVELDTLHTSSSSFLYFSLPSFVTLFHLPPDLVNLSPLRLIASLLPNFFMSTCDTHLFTSPSSSPASPRNLPLPFALKSPTSRAPHLPTSCAPLPRPLHLPTSCALLPRPLLVPLKSLSSFLPKWLRRRPRGTNTI